MPDDRLERTRRAYCACNGTGWICEDHPKQPFRHPGCGGAGDPCPSCAPELLQNHKLFQQETAR